MTIESARNEPEDRFRRSFLALLASSPLMLVSCKSLGTDGASSAALADKQVDLVIDSYNSLARSNPTLPGIQSLGHFNERLADGLSPADLSLLTAAFYLKARQQVARSPRAITMADVRSVVSGPIDMAPYGRPFLEQTLAEARAREAADPAYRRELQRHRRRCSCLWGTPCWICVAMAIILIIMIIAVILAL